MPAILPFAKDYKDITLSIPNVYRAVAKSYKNMRIKTILVKQTSKSSSLKIQLKR